MLFRSTGFTLASIPFFFMKKEGDEFHVIAPPLLWRWEDKEWTTTIALNGYLREAEGRSYFGIGGWGRRFRLRDPVSPTSVQTVRADFPHTAFVRGFTMQHALLRVANRSA